MPDFIRHVAKFLKTEEHQNCNQQYMKSRRTVMDKDRKVAAAEAEMKEVHLFLSYAMSGELEALKKFVEDYISNNSDKTHQITAEEVYRCIKDGNGRTALHFAAMSGRINVVNYLASDFSTQLLNEPDEKGMTAVSLAFITGNMKVAEALINAGANAAVADNEGVTCLHRASGHNDLFAVRYLCSIGVDLNWQSGAGNALHWAASEGHNEVVHELIKHGIDMDATNSQGLTAIVTAAAAGHGSTVVLLARSMAAVETTYRGGYTVLHICSDLGLSDAVEVLLELEESCKCATQHNDAGFLPLDLAAMAGHRDVVMRLLKHTFNADEEVPTIEEIMQVAAEKKKEMSNQMRNGKECGAMTADSFHLKETPKELFFISEESAKEAEEAKQQGNSAFSSKPPKYEEAIRFYSRAIELNPNNAVYYSNRSATWTAMSQHEKALKDAETCRKLNPTWTKACYRMAVARENLRMYEEAAVSAWEGIQIENDNKELKAILQRCVDKGRKAHMEKMRSNIA